MRRKESEFKTIFFSESGTQKINNDYFGYVQLDNYAIWVIADGYDGEEGANIASKLSVESAIEYFTAHPRFNKEVIKELFKYTNDKIKQKQEEIERYSLMHTSLLIVISNYNKILYGNIGNTRLYHIQGGYIVNQSSDDSISQLLVQERALDIKDIKSHRQRNDLLQAIGDYSKIKPIISNEIKLLEGDKICLTTRGTWENIDEHEIEVELSKFPERELWIDSIKRKVLGSSNKDIENNTFVSICIDKVAPPIAEKKSSKWLKRIILISAVILIMLLALLLWKLHKENKITKLAVSYVEKAEESIKIKNFDNANKSLKMAIEEYKEIRPSSQGFLGMLTNANNRRIKVDSKIKLVEDKIIENNKLKEAFKSVLEGNNLFDNNNFFESSKKYENAKYIFSNSSYMKDELNIEQVLEGLKIRINSTKSLIEALNVVTIGDNLFSSGNYKSAREKYEGVLNIFLLNGKEEYAIQIERKIKEIDDKVKLSYDGAQLIENKADMLSQIKPNDAREIYLSAKQIYQMLGDEKRSREIENKIQEINNRQLVDTQTANNYIQDGLNALLINDYSGSLNAFSKAKFIYNGLGDTANSKNIDNYISQAQNLMKNENKSKTELAKKERELEIEKSNIVLETKKREELASKIKEASTLEIEGDQMLSLNRYSESIIKYSSAKKIYDELKMSGDYDDQSSKVEYISKKISKCEGFLYEEQGDKKYENKEMKEAVKQYELSKDSFSKSDVGKEIIDRVEEKLKKSTKKANKKWWEIWKF